MMDFYKLSNNQFYIKRKLSLKSKHTTNFEDNYWHIVKDPDGNIRNRLEERDIYLDDIKYINKIPKKIFIDFLLKKDSFKLLRKYFFAKRILFFLAYFFAKL